MALETVTLLLNTEDGALYPANWPDRLRQIKTIKVKKVNSTQAIVEADQAGLAEIFRRLPFLRRDGQRSMIDKRETPEEKAAREAQWTVLSAPPPPVPPDRRVPG